MRAASIRGQPYIAHRGISSAGSNFWQRQSKMLDSRRSTGETDGRAKEQPRRFHFAATWSSLTAHLQLRESTGRTYAAHLQSSALALASPAVSPLAPRRELPSNGRWEMVVPKMVRTGRKTFEPAILNSPSAPALLPFEAPPMFANYGAQPFLSRAFSVIGRRTRALLAGPAPPETSGVPVLVQRNPRGPEIQDRNAARELLLSKIAQALRNRSSAGSTFAADRPQNGDKRWP